MLALALGMQDSSVQRIVLRAKVNRLILGTNTRWRTNTKKLTSRLTRPALRKTTPSAGALYGLGELMARDVDPVAQCFGRLSHLPTSAVHKLLTSLAEMAKASIWGAPSNVITYKLLFLRSDCDAELRQQAFACMRHPPRGSRGLYGFQTASLDLLEKHPVAFGSWLRNARLPENLYESIAGQVVEAFQYGRSHGRLASSLLRTGVPFLQALGALGLAGDVYGGEADLEFGELYETVLIVTGKPAVSFALSLCAVERLRAHIASCRGRVAGISYRLRELQRYPERAVGGAQNSDSESDRLQDDLIQHMARSVDVEASLERLSQTLGGILTTHPSLCEHLPDLELTLLACAPEVMIRVGELLGRSEAAERVLDSVIDRGTKVIGLKAPISFKGAENLTTKKFEEVREAMVRAIELRYERDPKGIARRTGQLLGELSKAGDAVLNAPYAAVRWPEVYQQALRRRLASVLIAIAVGSSQDATDKKGRRSLLELAIDQGEILLRSTRVDVDTDLFQEWVALSMIDVMIAGGVADRRSLWQGQEEFDLYARALAVWSCPAQVVSGEQNAINLFLAGTRGFQRRGGGSSTAIVRALHLLDVAFVAALQAQSQPAMKLLEQAWDSTVKKDLPGFDQFSGSYKLLSRAAAVPENTCPLAVHPFWAKSRSAAAITAACVVTARQ